MILPSLLLLQLRSPFPCMENNTADDVDMSATWLQPVATTDPRQDGRDVVQGGALPLPALQAAVARHRLEAIMNTDEAAAVAAVGLVGRATAVAAAASKSSLAFILGVADEDQSTGASFVDFAVRSRDESASENTVVNVAPPPPAAPRTAVKKSRICKFENCTRYVVNRGLCIGHGGGKRCAVVGCTSSAKNLGVCWKHGGSTKCTVAGCENRAKSRGVCWSHGGGRKCSEENCTKTAVSHGLCWAHGGGKRCVIEGCRKPAYERNGNVCSLHQAANGVSQKPAKR